MVRAVIITLLLFRDNALWMQERIYGYLLQRVAGIWEGMVKNMKIKKHFKRIITICLTALLATGSVAAPAAQAALHTGSGIRTAPKTQSAQKKVKWPAGPAKKSLSCESAIVMELSTGSVLYSKNIHDHHYPASITKILTTLLTLENSSLSDTVTFTEAEAYGIETGSSNLQCQPGEKFTVEQLLYGIMLQSANEMCLAAADHVAGSVENFVQMMNDRVAQLGLKDTHFMNPNGLHNDNHYTSAYDMALIAREAWKNKTFQKVTGTRTYSMGATNKRKASEIFTLLNHHQMINGYERPQYEYKYCVGGKTGYTSNAGSTLVTYAEKNGMQLVSVVMKARSPKQGEPNEYTDSTNLLNFGFENYKKYTLDEESSQINESLFNTFDSYFNVDESPLRLASASTVVLPKGVKLSAAKQKITYDTSVKIKSGENVIGKVTYTYGGRTVGSTDIIYDSTDTSTHLDEASRQIVDTEIQKIKTSTARHSIIRPALSSIKYGWINAVEFFQERVVLLVVIFLVALLIVLLILRYLMTDQARRRRNHSRRDRRSRQNTLNSRSSLSFGKHRGRRRRRTDYSGNRRQTTMRSSGGPTMSARKMKKNRKKTKESFGHSFYDF